MLRRYGLSLKCLWWMRKTPHLSRAIGTVIAMGAVGTLDDDAALVPVLAMVTVGMVGMVGMVGTVGSRCGLAGLGAVGALVDDAALIAVDQ